MAFYCSVAIKPILGLDLIFMVDICVVSSDVRLLRLHLFYRVA
jgi:hypothetical protein